jgi:hypothetical protein
MNDVKTVVLRGKVNYAKVLGAPVGNKFDDTKNWSMDLILDNNAVKEVKALGIGDKVKSKDNYLDGQSFLSFKQSEFKRDGTPNKPIDVKDIVGNPWPQDKLIGNGTDVDVKFVVMDYGVGKKKGVYIRSVRVLSLVPYERQEFNPLSEDDPFYKQLAEAEAMAAAMKESEDRSFKETFVGEDLDDDLPV